MKQLYRLFDKANFKLVIAIILFAYLYEKIGIKDYFDNYIVKKLLHLITIKSTTELIGLIVLIGLVLFNFSYKAFRLKSKPCVKWSIIIFTLCGFYLYYRNEYIQNSIYSIPKIYLSDIIYSIVNLGYTTQWIMFWSIKNPDYKTKPHFTKDTIYYNDKKSLIEDKLNRSKFATKLGTYILNTQGEGSLNIGIEGSWGTGKSYMLSLIKKELDNKAIVIDFNPWKSHASQNILRDFFRTISNRLKKYDQGIHSSFSRYLSLIFNSITYRYKFFSFAPGIDIKQQQENLDNKIKKLGRPVVIFIDDLDRLHSQEIFEVLKLIRNTASFTNTTFVVAFDYKYLHSILKKETKLNKNYIEKIFQVIFPLPVFDDKMIIKEIERYLLENVDFDKKLKGELHYVLNNYQQIITTELNNMRNVIRFANQFSLSLGFLDNDLDFRDLFLLELLKFKDLQLVKDIYYNRWEYFNRNGKKDSFFSYSTKSPGLKKLEETNNPQLKLIKALFTRGTSINHIDNFYKYFSLSLFEGDLSSQEFEDTLLLANLDILLNIIDSWLEQKITREKILNKLSECYFENLLSKTTNKTEQRELLTRTVAVAKYLMLNKNKDSGLPYIQRLAKRLINTFINQLGYKVYEEAFVDGFMLPDKSMYDFDFFVKNKVYYIGTNKPIISYIGLSQEYGFVISYIGLSQEKICSLINDLFPTKIEAIKDAPLEILKAFVKTIEPVLYKFSDNNISIVRSKLLENNCYYKFVKNNTEILAKLNQELNRLSISKSKLGDILDIIFPITHEIDIKKLIANFKLRYSIFKVGFYKVEDAVDRLIKPIRNLHEHNIRIEDFLFSEEPDDYDQKFMNELKERFYHSF